MKKVVVPASIQREGLNPEEIKHMQMCIKFHVLLVSTQKENWYRKVVCSQNLGQIILLSLWSVEIDAY